MIEIRYKDQKERWASTLTEIAITSNDNKEYNNITKKITLILFGLLTFIYGIVSILNYILFKEVDIPYTILTVLAIISAILWFYFGDKRSNKIASFILKNIVRYILKIRFKDNELFSDEYMEVKLYDESIVLMKNGAIYNLPLKSIDTVNTTKESIAIKFKGGVATIIPVDSFKSEDDKINFEKIVKSNVKVKAKKISSKKKAWMRVIIILLISGLIVRSIVWKPSKEYSIKGEIDLPKYVFLLDAQNNGLNDTKTLPSTKDFESKGNMIKGEYTQRYLNNLFSNKFMNEISNREYKKLLKENSKILFIKSESKEMTLDNSTNLVSGFILENGTFGVELESNNKEIYTTGKMTKDDLVNINMLEESKNIDIITNENDIPYDESGTTQNDIINKRYEEVNKYNLSYKAENESEYLLETEGGFWKEDIIHDETVVSDKKYNHILKEYSYEPYKNNDISMTYDEAMALVENVLPDDIMMERIVYDDVAPKDDIVYSSSQGNFVASIYYEMGVDENLSIYVNKSNIVGIEYLKEVNK